MSRRPKIKITAALITLDEAQNLRELLPRLDWVDEIVVVDSGSSDATVAVAQEHGCRVAERPFDTFARQRNHALSMSRSDWVFSIDADERPILPLADEIRRRIAPPEANAFRLPIRSTIFGRRLRRCGTQDDRPIRLFRRDAARWTGDVHEVLRVDGRVEELESWLTHDTLPDLESFLAKMHRYTRLEAHARLRAGRKPSWRDAWLAPAREFVRRLLWKRGILDGPSGWAFCALSGLSEWVLSHRHRLLWAQNTGEIDDRTPQSVYFPKIDPMKPNTTHRSQIA